MQNPKPNLYNPSKCGRHSLAPFILTPFRLKAKEILEQGAEEEGPDQDHGGEPGDPAETAEEAGHLQRREVGELVRTTN